MEFFLQFILAGFVTGAVYSLLSIGYAIPFYLQINNFAHGALVVSGAFLGYVLIKYLDVNIFLTAVVVIAAGILLGIAIYYVVINRVRKFKSWAVIVAGTLGVGIIIENIILIIFGYEQFSVRMILVNVNVYSVWGIYLSNVQLLIMLSSMILLSSILIIMKKTKLGLQFSSVAEDYEASYIMGISPEKISLIAFIMGCSLATLAGFLISFEYDFNYSSGYVLLLNAYTATVIGGTKDLRKVALAAYSIGVFEKLVGGYISTEYMHASVFLLLIAFLVIKKEGLEKIYELREV